MSISPMSEIVQHLRRTMQLPEGAGMTDGDLLEDFVTRRDGAAFAALVRRHGPMVWGVCRRVVPGHQDAEDAFQATFLVLVRKAASVLPREMIGNWLYGVAHQTALNARASAARRRTRERQVTEMPEPAADQQDLWCDLQPILDQELSRLPNRYRAAIVLCDLEGKTRREVARQLGVPEGTLSGWLTRGRAMLAKRLTRHGLTVSGGVLASVVSENALSAGVPATVVSTTINSAMLLAAGPTATTGVVSTQVAALTEGVLRTMLLTKLKIATAVLLVLSAGLGATGLIQYAHASKAPPQAVLLAGDAQKPGTTRVATRQGKNDLKITVGKETTYISGPFDNDGYVDYETAINEKISKGIAPENNANVLLWQALRPEPKRTPMPPDFFRWLKAPSLPQQGDYFVDLPRYATETLKLNPAEQTDELRKQRYWASRRTWITQDYPRIADWLKANEKPLALVCEATRRPDYYNPLVARKSGAEGWYGLIGALLPGAVKCQREVGPALAVRAMLHAGEGRFEEAWQDLLTCHRLGRLIARGADYDEFVLGRTIDQDASDAVLALLDRANLTAKQVQVWQHDLNQLPTIPSVAEKVDLGMRYTFLNNVMLARRGPARTLKLIAVLEGRGKSTPGIIEPEPAQAALESIDWDSILRTGNSWYDRMVAATRIKDRAARQNEINQMDEELKALLKEAGTPADLIKALREQEVPGKDVSKHLGAILTEFTLMRILYTQKVADRDEQAQRNRQVALALAAYRGDNGRYPEKLDALVPKYLEAVPNDLYSGKALIYRPSADGYLLYSVGFNGRDEGGNDQNDTPRGDDPHVRMPLPQLNRK